MKYVNTISKKTLISVKTVSKKSRLLKNMLPNETNIYKQKKAIIK